MNMCFSIIRKIRTEHRHKYQKEDKDFLHHQKLYLVGYSDGDECKINQLPLTHFMCQVLSNMLTAHILCKIFTFAHPKVINCSTLEIKGLSGFFIFKY